MVRGVRPRIPQRLIDRARTSKAIAPFVARHARGLRSHTAFGEDLVLGQVFRDLASGTYVDVGAYHPTDGSLTHRLFLRGWSGFNIDASEAAIERMRLARPSDRHLVAAIGTPGDDATFVEFDDGSVSSADPDLADQRRAAGHRVVRTSTVRLRGLADALGELGVPRRFELLTIDIEGLDDAALHSNDWDAFRPAVVCVEDPLAAFGDPESTPIGAVLTSLGYLRLAALPPTSCFAEPDVVDRLVRGAGRDPDRVIPSG